MSNITTSEYWTEVVQLANAIVQDAADRRNCNTAESFDRYTVQDKIFDNVLHETIDGHQWVIYSAYNTDVLQNSDNAEYGIEQGLIDAAESIKNGLNTLHCHLAFWALYADVADKISEALDDYETKLEEEAEADQAEAELNFNDEE